MTADRARAIAAEIDDQNRRMTGLVITFAITAVIEIGILVVFLIRL